MIIVPNLIFNGENNASGDIDRETIFVWGTAVMNIY